MSEVNLNLARKWRSKQFEEIVGQDISIRMLKNSLYLQRYFPVYLFSGQRGCGKTTTARVFSASLNCQKLSEFQKNPQNQIVPCLQCVSCKAMEQGNHPDFIEIDAASHTGVDHMRTLIDSASLLPLMGSKKIYLIDEAHMLSKAAFNALLKILEEPPSSVIFILATTDPQKIIDTVHSRCFQLFFRPVDMEVLHTRLRHVCASENIVFDDGGLALIIQQTDGSVRDALNLLEQVRFSNKQVTHKAVLDVLGFIDDAILIALFHTLITSLWKDVLQSIVRLQWERYSAHIIWIRLLELLRALLWVKYDVMPQSFNDSYKELKNIAVLCTAEQLTTFLQMMYDKEFLFSKTTAKHALIELVLMQMSQYIQRFDSDEGSSLPSNQVPVTLDTAHIEEQLEEDEQDEQEGIDKRWEQFIELVKALNDPLIYSIFRQGILKSFDAKTEEVLIEFSKEFIFFEDLLKETTPDWYPCMQEIFGNSVKMQPVFTGESRAIPKKITGLSVVLPQSKSLIKDTQTKKLIEKAPYKRATMPAKKSLLKNPFTKETPIDISDGSIWPKAHMLMHYFPGTITEIRE